MPHNYPLETLEPGLSEKAFYDPGNFTYPAGSYVCEVEIDPDTGVVSIVKFSAVDDFGHVINPMIVEGQVHGGIAQGIGQALLENCVYDDNGQLLTGSYMDYCMPRADDLPNFEVDMTVTPCTHNPLAPKAVARPGRSARRLRSLMQLCALWVFAISTCLPRRKRCGALFARHSNHHRAIHRGEQNVRI